MNFDFLDNDEKKPLDTPAYLMILIGGLTLVLTILLYIFFNQQQKQQTVSSIYAYDGIWLATPKHLLWLNKQHPERVAIEYKDLGLARGDVVADMFLMSVPNLSMADNIKNLWLRLTNAQVYQCQVILHSHQVEVKKACELLPETKNLKTFAQILPLRSANQVLLVDNASGLMQRYDATTGKKIANVEYKVPALPTFEQLEQQIRKRNSLDKKSLDKRPVDKLYQANYGQVFSADIGAVASSDDINQKTLYIQTDTGNYRLLAWQMTEDGLPDFAKPAIIWLTTHSQPIDIAMIPKDDDRNVVNWITLESDAEVRRYNHLLGKEAVGNTIRLPIREPAFLRQIDDTQILVVDKPTGHILSLNLTNPAKPDIQTWQPPLPLPEVDKMNQWRNYYDWLSNLSLSLLFVPMYALWWLVRENYQLAPIKDDEEYDEDE